MKLIIGLGNPGQKYEKTRHNLGFMVIDELAREWTKGEVKWQRSAKFKSQFLETDVKRNARAGSLSARGEKLLLVKPQTYMNNSGMAVSLISQYFNLLISDLWVIYDDLDIQLGHLKIAKGKGTAGHHGVASVIKTLDTADFVRFRLGIAREHITNPEKFVLEPFLPQESGEVRHMIKQAVKAIEVVLKDGVEKAMSQFNR